MGFRSSLATLFTPDSPIVAAANWFLDRADRQYIDDQIRALQSEATLSFLRGQQSTNVKLSLSSATGAAGDCVCVAPAAAIEDDPLTAERSVTRALSASVSAAGVVFGILATAAAPGAYARVITGGIVGRSLTGLAAGNAGLVRLNGTTARLERVSAFEPGDYPVGYVDALGNLSIGIGRAHSDAVGMHRPVRVATAAALPSYTRTGAVITATTNSLLASIDGISALAVGDRVLVKDGAAASDNGIYTITALGGTSPYILTRTSDSLHSMSFGGVSVGTANGGKFWKLTTQDPFTVGSTGLTFVVGNLS